ncbi:unnamed protein product [Vicia faba]|uniref:DUF1685 family protein n=1 Tax=Vicia faba TaxID=3906 RepID=A0AAV1B8G1_VICFA|nr:unnamed protein product [Vicia faba]
MEHFMKLFDSFWFEVNILNINTTSSITKTISKENLKDCRKNETSSAAEEEPKLARIRTVHNRSMSDQSITSLTSFNHDSLSPDSVLVPLKLQTIFSGKEVTDSEDKNLVPTETQTQTLLLPKKNNMNKVVKKKRESKSLSDLEFEELKGFMDLGFVFSEEDKDSNLVSIIPGPYLSEAWEVHERKKEKPLMKWKVPAMKNEIDMKNSLRLWAHTVASTVR